jgi:hypothetical protein
MTRNAIILRILLVASLCIVANSCTMRYECIRDVSSVALSKPKGGGGDALSDRVSSYLPAGERKSGFEITHLDSIKEGGFACGNPLIVTAMTFGLVPSTIPIRFDVTVTGKDRGKVLTRNYWVAMDGRYSAWNSLIPKSSDDKAIAKGLLDSVDRNQLTPNEFISTASKR